MNNKNFRVLLLFTLLIASGETFAGWMANADFSACPRKYFPNTSAQEGPFNSSSECQTHVNNAARGNNVTCARYSCTEVGSGTTSSSGSASSGQQQLDKSIGDAVSAGLSGQISGADAVGLVGLGMMGKAVLGAGEKAPETPEQAAQRVENQRNWAEQQARQAEQERLKEVSYQMEQDAESFKMMDLAAADFQASASSVTPPAASATPPPAKPTTVSQAFNQGFEHASSCISENSGTACAGSTSPTCHSDYKAGFSAGNIKYKLIMQQAFQEGKAAGAKKEPMNGGASANAEGPCRYQWIQQYNKGHWAGRHPKK